MLHQIIFLLLVLVISNVGQGLPSTLHEKCSLVVNLTNERFFGLLCDFDRP